MITQTEFAEALKDGNLREKMIAVLMRDYPRTQRETLEDIVQDSLCAMAGSLRKGEIINVSVEQAALNIVQMDAINWHEQVAIRRRLREGIRLGTGRAYDPTRRLDFKVDLERAIDAVGVTSDMQRMAILVCYAGLYPDDLVEELGLTSETAKENWMRQARRVVQRVRREMKRKGYRRLR